MGRLIKLWIFQAFIEYMEALEYFKKTGDRVKLRECTEKYSERIEEELESEANIYAMEERIKGRESLGRNKAGA